MANPEHLAILKEALDKNIHSWNRWRKQNPNIIPDLSGADLRHAHLWSSNLIRANLIEANLASANLVSAKLMGANLKEANLTGVYLREANLSGANLSFATLFLSELSYTVFSNTNFNQTRLLRTSFANVDLSTAKNLDKADVKGPCPISIGTLYQSQAVLGEAWFQDFLRDCGVPDTMVTYASSLVVKPIDFYSCFISYSSANEDFAKLLYDTLRGAGIRVWYAPEQILPGHNIEQEIMRGIQHWDKVILCCSESALTEKWWVDFERNLAKAKEQQLQREYKQSIPTIIPLDLDGYVMSDAYKNHPNHNPTMFFQLIADFTDWKNHDSFKRGVDRLVRALQTDDGREDPPPSKLKPKNSTS